MDERTAFERWLEARQGLQADWDARRNCYTQFAAHLAWKAWQERASHSAEGKSHD